ncbi:MAG: hypothetical protein FWG16_00750 [Micrococcales bacterium]|nr:hypothetical protein [Micrococcales bacterium]
MAYASKTVASSLVFLILAGMASLGACAQSPATTSPTDAATPPSTSDEEAQPSDPEEGATEPEEGATEPEEGEPNSDSGQTGGSLTGRSVFFAHMSVGENIVHGIEAIDPSIDIMWCDDAGTPGLTECTLGYNGDPLQKLTEFEAMMDADGNRSQIAFMKFCYSDFQPEISPDAVFDTYVATFNELEKRYPNVTFIHVTAPLSAAEVSWTNDLQDTFNTKLRAQYGSLVFDLADLESAGTSGTPTLSLDGVSPAMAEEFSEDGGHLNAAGSYAIAEKLLDFLRQVPLKS